MTTVVRLTTIDNCNTQIREESSSGKLDLVQQLQALIDIKILETSIGTLVIVEQEAVPLVESGILEQECAAPPYSYKLIFHYDMVIEYLNLLYHDL